MASRFSMCGRLVRHLCSASGWPETCCQPSVISLYRLLSTCCPLRRDNGRILPTCKMATSQVHVFRLHFRGDEASSGSPLLTVGLRHGSPARLRQHSPVLTPHGASAH